METPIIGRQEEYIVGLEIQTKTVKLNEKPIPAVKFEFSGHVHQVFAGIMYFNLETSGSQQLGELSVNVGSPSPMGNTVTMTPSASMRDKHVRNLTNESKLVIATVALVGTNDDNLSLLSNQPMGNNISANITNIHTIFPALSHFFAAYPAGKDFQVNKIEAGINADLNANTTGTFNLNGKVYFKEDRNKTTDTGLMKINAGVYTSAIERDAVKIAYIELKHDDKKNKPPVDINNYEELNGAFLMQKFSITHHSNDESNLQKIAIGMKRDAKFWSLKNSGSDNILVAYDSDVIMRDKGHNVSYGLVGGHIIAFGKKEKTS